MTGMSANGSPRFTLSRICPTIYFVSSRRGLLHGVDIEVTNRGEPRDAALRVAAGTRVSNVSMGRVASGVHACRVYVPDIREEADVEFRLASGGSVVGVRTMKWRPQRHWTIHLCQAAHFDPGYTDLPSNVMREYLGFLDQVVEWCERTRRWPPAARFHYTVEQAWVAVHYVEHRPPQAVERFVRFCRSGQIEVNAFYANMASELMGPEEAARLLYPAFKLKRLYGIPIRTAEHNDVPGMSWAYATILAEAGIEVFIPGIPDYFHNGERHRQNFADHLIRPRDRPEAFYWEAQNGRRILTYLPRQAGGDPDSNLSALPSVLRRLEEAGYRYNTLRYLLTGGARDNAPPLFEFAPTVRDWNRRWAYPRYLLSTNHEFASALSREIGDDIPTYRGDYPGTDYPLGATSTAEDVGANRNAKGFLFTGERLAAIASEISDCPYPREALERAYRAVLQHDEHAWGLSRPAGWAAEAHRREKALYAYEAAALAEDVLLKSANRIADEIQLKEGGDYIVAFNPLDFPRSDFVSVPFYPARSCGMPMHRVPSPPGDQCAPIWQPGLAIGRMTRALPPGLVENAYDLVDVETGTTVPHQATTSSSPSDPARFAAELHTMGTYAPEFRTSVSFIARDVPALGYRTFRIVADSGGRAGAGASSSADDSIENEFYRITADRLRGAVVSIYDKELERELVDGEAPYSFGQLFSRDAGTGAVETGLAAVRGGAAGPVVSSLVIEGAAAGAPRISMEILLFSGIKRIDCRLRILKDGDGTRAFYVAFPFRFSSPRFTFEGPANTIRPIEDQLPGTTTDYYAVGTWAQIREADGSMSVVWSAREAPMVQFSENWPDYVSPAHHGVVPHDFDHEFLTDPHAFARGHLYSYLATNNFRTNFAASQPGMIHSTYSVTSGRTMSAEEARRLGWQCCHPMTYAILRGRQSGALPPAHGFCSVDPPGVMVTTIKRAEDGDDLIVRLLETEGTAKAVTVSIPFFAFAEAIQTNLIEENQRALGVFGTGFRVHVEAWSFATVRLVRQRARDRPAGRSGSFPGRY